MIEAKVGDYIHIRNCNSCGKIEGLTSVGNYIVRTWYDKNDYRHGSYRYGIRQVFTRTEFAVVSFEFVRKWAKVKQIAV